MANQAEALGDEPTGAIMNVDSLFTTFYHSPLARRSAIALVAVGWSPRFLPFPFPTPPCCRGHRRERDFRYALTARRAYALQPWGREFDPPQVHQLTHS